MGMNSVPTTAEDSDGVDKTPNQITPGSYTITGGGLTLSVGTPGGAGQGTGKAVTASKGGSETRMWEKELYQARMKVCVYVCMYVCVYVCSETRMWEKELYQARMKVCMHIWVHAVRGECERRSCIRLG